MTKGRSHGRGRETTRRPSDQRLLLNAAVGAAGVTEGEGAADGVSDAGVAEAAAGDEAFATADADAGEEGDRAVPRQRDAAGGETNVAEAEDEAEAATSADATSAKKWVTCKHNAQNGRLILPKPADEGRREETMSRAQVSQSPMATRQSTTARDATTP